MNLQDKPFYLTKEQAEKVKAIVFNMTDNQKVGQLFCPCAGSYSKEELTTLVKEYNVGALFYRPTDSATLKRNFDYIDKIAKIPLLHAANLETGGIGAVTDGTYFANPMGVAAADDLDITDKFAKVCASEGLRNGINWSFSPVADINYNSLNPITHVRAYSDNPDIVLKNTVQFVKSMQNEGMVACAKHFPGDGVDFRDQHLHPTYNSLSANEWYNSYGRVYKSLIDEGILSIMAGHICQIAVTLLKNPMLKPEEVLPASVCKEMLTDVLRNEFGFNGLITTDATIMAGYYHIGDRRLSLPMSIEAGCDMLLFNENFYEDYNAVLDGLKNGILSHKRLNEAVMRILALKERVCKNIVKSQILPHEWQKICADKAVTLVKNNIAFLPLMPEKTPKIKIAIFGDDKIEGGKISEIALDYLNANNFEAEMYDKNQDIKTKTPVIIFAAYGSASGRTTVRLFWDKAPIKSDFIANENNIFVSLGYPYHLQDVPRIKTFINAYSPNKVTLLAVLEKIIGKSEFKGKSPVDAFCGMIDTKI